MKNIKRILLFSLLCMLLISACTSIPSNSIMSNKNIEAQSPTKVVVRILDLDSISKTLAPTDLPTYTPVVVATQQATVSPTRIPPTPVQLSAETASSTPSGCTNQAKFLKSLTINDDTALKAGESFTKIWQIENVGTCTWNTSYSLVFSGGETMGGALSSQLSQEVKPGEKLDLHLKLMAPLYAQSYTGNWMLQDAAGNIFGIGDQSDQPLSVTIAVKPPVTPYQG